MALALSGSVSISGSLNVGGSAVVLSSATSSLSASYAVNATTAQTSSYASSFVVGGTLTAQTLVVQTITSSVEFVTGSNRFGSTTGNTHEFTGSILVNGSVSFGSSSISEGVQGASSLSIIPSSSISGGPLIQFPPNGRIRPASTGDRLSIDGNALYLNSTFSSTVSIAAGGGNVGIGTTNPSGTYGKLSVAGGISILNDNNAKLEIGRYSSGTPNSYIKIGANSNSLRFTNNTDTKDLLYLTNSGSLGLGTTPSAWTTPFTVIQGGSYGQSIGFQSNGPDIKIGTNNYYYGGSYLYTTSNGAAQFNIGGNSGFQFNTAPSGTADGIITFTRVVTITQGGVVGIGITNPSSTYLDIIGSNSSTNSLQLRSGNVDTGTSSNQILFGYNNTESFRHAIKTRHMSEAASGNSIDFYVWKQGTDSSGTIGTQHVMSINGGRVGIGNTSPIELLDITKNGNQSDVNWGSIMIRNIASYSIGNDASIGFALNNAGNTNCDPRASIGCKTESSLGGALVFNTRYDAGTYTEKMRIIGDGSVGIGVTNPQSKLHINGSLTFTEPGYNTVRKHSIYNSHSDGSSPNNYLAFNVSDGSGTTAERMRINGNGHLTLPYQPAFYAYTTTGADTSSTGAFTSFNTTRVNRGSHYNTSNGRFTAPITGVYEFVFSLLWRQSNVTGNGEISIGVNGSNINARGMAYSQSGGADNMHAQTLVRAILSLSAGDYVTGWIHALGSTGTNFYYGDNLGYFSGYLLG